MSAAPFHDPPLAVGDAVHHSMSGWSGIVKDIRPDTTGMAGSQGQLVEVEQVQAAGRGWKNIVVTEAELELVANERRDPNDVVWWGGSWR